MISGGRAVLSLKNRKENEFFILYQGNYFGDYQILLNHRATETYSVFGNQPLFTHCLDKKEFLEIMRMFPTCFCLFFRRAVDRRIEVRRIKKMFEIYTGIENGLVLKSQVHEIGVSGLLKRAEDRKEVVVKRYTDDHMPRHLSNPDFYFRKFEQCIDMQNIAAESDTEKTPPDLTVD